jgi:hypothetical protein
MQDGTLPGHLHWDQIWVRPNGRVQLLDMPWNDTGMEPFAGSDDERVLALLRDAAVLALEGRLRRAGDRPHSIRAPLPKHAVRLLNRLLSVDQPYATLDEFRSVLAATKELPTEVTRHRRAWHLGGLTACLAVGLLWTLSCSWIMSIGSGAQLEWFVFINDKVIKDLKDGAWISFAAQSASPDPWTRYAAVPQLSFDLELHKRLSQDLERARLETVARFAAADGTTRWLMEANRTYQQLNPDEPTRNDTVTIKRSGDFRALARELEPGLQQTEGQRLRALEPTVLALLLFWPCVWILWAFLTRGGLTRQLFGIAITRADGRPALRLQCALRALLVWAPFMGLLWLAIVLDHRYWSHWSPGALVDRNAWALWLSWSSWWLAAAMLPVYVGLALRNPPRGLHDRLAGTYLVPR